LNDIRFKCSGQINTDIALSSIFLNVDFLLKSGYFLSFGRTGIIIYRRIRMKTLFTIVLILVCICGCAIPFVADQEASGTVSITYVLHRTPTSGSNQVAVWIEDEDGNYVKSLYATRYAADGGFKQRPDTLSEWVRISDWENASPVEVDAVSGATQAVGTQTVEWDLTDRSGVPVSTGTYIYKIEGNISRANRVVWQGSIDVGSKGNTSMAEGTYYPTDAAEKGLLLEEVKAVYSP